jgi:parvulin-like peptidyl-prolyl isomerase
MAVDHSEDDVTRHRGGDAGWLDAGVAYRWPAPVVQAGFALKSGEVSDPIEADGAAYLVRKIDERPSARIPLARVRDQLRREMHAEKLRVVEETFASRLRQDVTIETFPDTLKGLKVPVPDAKSIAAEEVPPGIP